VTYIAVWIGDTRAPGVGRIGRCADAVTGIVAVVGAAGALCSGIDVAGIGKGCQPAGNQEGPVDVIR